MISEQPSYWVMLQELMQLCARHNIQVNSIKREEQGKEYDIALTWVEPRHDGSKCGKLLIEEESKPLHNLVCVTDPAITKLELNGAKSEEPDADREKEGEHLAEVKSYTELEKGDHVLYYGQAHSDRHGDKAAVKAAYRDDNVVVRFLSDDVTTSTGVNKLKKVVYDGA